MRRTAALLLPCLLVLASCAGADEPVSPRPGSNAAATGGATPPAAAGGLPAVSGAPGQQPAITKPSGQPPADLVSRDLQAGTGAQAQAQSTVTIQYLGASWSTGEEFDSSWRTGQPATFPLAQLIPCWQQAVPGMKVGGRRLLSCPPATAYGDAPPPGSGIEPGETLLFVIDLLEVR